VYTFPYPILSDDSKEKVRNVWCAQDPAAAWDDWMLHGKVPATAHCDAPVEQILALGQRLMVRGTPTVFFANGVRASGALSLDQLNIYLN
jgi:thiol:disulfide interchange protein DsbC